MHCSNQSRSTGALRPAAASLACLLASVGLTILAAGDPVLPGDVAVARAAQGLDIPGLLRFTRGVNWVGAGAQLTSISLLLIALLVIARRPHLALLLLAATSLRALNSSLKAIADSPRPSDTLIAVTEWTNSGGFPSGHAMGAMIVYGAFTLIAASVIKRPRARLFAQGCAILMIALTGFSRIYTGAHWPSDVLGGYLWGLTLLFMLLAVANWLGNRKRAGA